MTFHVDKFEDINCRAGGEHQWFGDGIVYFSNGTQMNARKFKLLSPKMQKEYDAVGEECTCNKCGIEYTTAFNPHF